MATPSTAWEARAAAGEPAATVKLNGLSTTLAAHDAWGRDFKPQPAFISVEIGLSKPFSVSSQGDVVEADTVHYGLLSKYIQSVVQSIDGGAIFSSLSTIVEGIWKSLIREGNDGGKPFLDNEAICFLQMSILLPKATLLGGGLSLAYSQSMRNCSTVVPVLKFHDLKIPTLVGVNSNERDAEQMVTANIEIERWDATMERCHEIEKLITRTMRNSSYKTLEALATKLSLSIYQHLRENYPIPTGWPKHGWRLRISLEKPIAVAMADGPCVQLNIDTNDLDSAEPLQ